MSWQPGDPIVPRQPLTVSPLNCRIGLNARGVATFVDPLGGSFYLERGMPGAGYIEAHCPADVFTANFERDFAGIQKPQYRTTQHFQKVFPASFFGT
jgi:hypothetical protein